MFCDQTAKRTFETFKPLYISILKASLVLAICEAQAGLDLPAHAPKCQSFFLQTILFLPLCYVSRTIKEEAVVRDHYSKCLHFTEGWETSWRSPHVPGLQRGWEPPGHTAVLSFLSCWFHPSFLPRPALAHRSSTALAAHSFLVLLVYSPHRAWTSTPGHLNPFWFFNLCSFAHSRRPRHICQVFCLHYYLYGVASPTWRII